MSVHVVVFRGECRSLKSVPLLLITTFMGKKHRCVLSEMEKTMTTQQSRNTSLFQAIATYPSGGCTTKVERDVGAEFHVKEPTSLIVTHWRIYDHYSQIFKYDLHLCHFATFSSLVWYLLKHTGTYTS